MCRYVETNTTQPILISLNIHLLLKKYLLPSFALLFFISVNAQDFIIRWDMSKLDSNLNGITFNVESSGTVDYTWETIPSGTSATGIMNGGSAYITGLPTNAINGLQANPILLFQVPRHKAICRQQAVISP